MSNIGHNGGPRDSSDGWFVLHRSMIDHPVVGFGQPVKPADPRRGSYSRAEAWIWLIQEASYSEHVFHGTDFSVTLEAGQLVGGRKHLSDVWNWTEKTVRGFLGKLQAELMITIVTDQIRAKRRANSPQVLTLCNYLQYQLRELVEGPTEGPTKGQRRANAGPTKGQTINKGKEIHTHADARAHTREAGPNEQEVDHGVIFNCETVRHKDGLFAISIPGIQVATQGTVPRERVEAIVKAYALQWGLEIEAGKDPRKVVPNDAMAYLSAQVRKEFMRPIEAEFKRKRVETVAQKQKAELNTAWKQMLEEERSKLGGK